MSSLWCVWASNLPLSSSMCVSCEGGGPKQNLQSFSSSPLQRWEHFSRCLHPPDGVCVCVRTHENEDLILSNRKQVNLEHCTELLPAVEIMLT